MGGAINEPDPLDSKKQQGGKVADLAALRDEIIAALDLLITGI